MPEAIYIADAGPAEVVIYLDKGDGSEPEVYVRYPLHGRRADEVLGAHGWYRLRTWRVPQEAPDHRAAQVTPDTRR